MSTASWDPSQYLRFADARSRPFADLLAPVGAVAPRTVVDAGCGPGTLTATLAERWPTAHVLGFDSSPAMIERAAPLETDRLRFVLADATTWAPDDAVDVLVSNALLHWIDGHDRLAVRWFHWLAPDGWFAFQLPGNFASPSHRLIGDQLAEPRWRDVLPAGFALAAGAFAPEHYFEVLADAGAAVDAWETTYLHLLAGEDPVLEWIKGTALRPVLDALGDQDARDAFLDQLAPKLRAAYPPGRHGTIFPFRRVFVVAHRA